MFTYILRRLLLMPLTLLGVTFLVFSITRLMPGGPIEQMLQRNTAGEGAKGTAEKSSNSSINETDMERLEEQFGLNEAIFPSWLQWLGILPRETQIARQDFADSNPETQVILGTTGITANVTTAKTITFHDFSGKTISPDGWDFRIESPMDRAQRWAKRMRISNEKEIEKRASSYAPRAVVFRKEFDGVLQGSFGSSFKYNESVWDMMMSRIPVSAYFGLLAALITYSVCIPLGIVKAIRHRSMMDNISSGLIFAGYAIPGFALGAVLLVFFGARLPIFPLFGITSPDFSQMNFWQQIQDIAWHSVLPLICYTIGSFALMTMMVKNNLMDHLAADYVRTAMAKGLPFRKAILHHALRNSFIPIASSLGNLISLLVAGSMLIERVFDIQGFGLLNFQAVVDKDFPLIMGTLTLSAILLVIGNLLSDILVALIDPRISYSS